MNMLRNLNEEMLAKEALKKALKPLKPIKQRLPIGIRCMIYSYIDLMTLLRVISKLSKTDRDTITHSDLLDQKRCLKIYIKQGRMIQFPQLVYCTKLATEFELVIEKMQEQDIFIFQTILHMIGLQNKKVSIIIGLCQQINFMCFKLAIMKEHQKMIRCLTLILLEQCD